MAETSKTDASTDNDTLLSAERDIVARFGDQPFDFPALQAIQNIYRAAAAVRRQAERGVLADYGLTWARLTILWVLWVWDDMETARLADECGLAKGTLTGVLNTLEGQEFISRERMPSDKRRVLVALTAKGRATIEELYPKFNEYETAMCAGLSIAEQAELARMLRVVTMNADIDELDQ